jgi:cytochrome c553
VLYLALILSGTIVLFAYFGPYLNPRGFTFRIAMLFMVCGLAVTGAAEYMRELLRKPYVVYDYMYTNGIRKEDVSKIASKGFIDSGVWTKASASCAKDETSKGEIIFRYQCMGCHTENGYRGIKKLIGDRDEDSIKGFLSMIKETDKSKNPYLNIMPPLVCNDEESAALSKYLASLNGKSGEPKTGHKGSSTHKTVATGLENSQY